jgi:hypothetical protein
MTTTKASGKKAPYIRHSQEYKGEALKLAAAIGNQSSQATEFTQITTVPMAQRQ